MGLNAGWRVLTKQLKKEPSSSHSGNCGQGAVLIGVLQWWMLQDDSICVSKMIGKLAAVIGPFTLLIIVFYVRLFNYFICNKKQSFF